MIDKFFTEIGIKPNHNIIVHASYKSIRHILNNIKANIFIDNLKEFITQDGSIIFPTFTYCFKKKYLSSDFFDREHSVSKVGYLSEVFRKSNDVLRTDSPTHSFSLWGKVINDYLKYDIEKVSLTQIHSPLGMNSTLGWLINQSNSYALLIGCDFSSFSFIHYLEVYYKVKWSDIFCWDYLDIESAGASASGFITLREVPGCSNSFVKLENFLLNRNQILKNTFNNVNIYYIELPKLLNDCKYFFEYQSKDLLCSTIDCKPCNERRVKMNYNL